MKKIFLIWILVLFCAVAAEDLTRAEDLNTGMSPRSISKKEAELRSSMRMLWESRAILLRAYIVSAVNDSKDTDEAKDRLLKNAGDLGDSIRPYYGSWASSILTGFLKKDVGLTGKVIEAAKAGNEEALNLTKKAREAALNLTKEAREEALSLTKKAGEEALDLAMKAQEGSSGPTGKAGEEVKNVTGEADTAALYLTKEAREADLDLTAKAKEVALDLTEKEDEEPLDLTEKAKEKAFELTEKAKGKAVGLTEKAKEKALTLIEKSDKGTPDLVNKDKAKGLIEKAREIAMDLIKKANEIALDLTEKARIRALARAKKAREEALELAKRRWYGNARDLAGFFAIPHNQTKKDLTDMLCKHLDLTWGEIESILKKDEAKDLDYYEKDRAHMMTFSDVLVDGLVKQFPGRFKE